MGEEGGGWVTLSNKALLSVAVIYYCSCAVVYSDVDECTASSPVCDVNANCTDTRGSYRCTCKSGFSGDGKTCKGDRLYNI